MDRIYRAHGLLVTEPKLSDKYLTAPRDDFAGVAFRRTQVGIVGELVSFGEYMTHKSNGKLVD